VISSLFWVATQRILVVTDVSRQPIGRIFKGQAHTWILKTEPRVFLETSVTNYQSILRNIPEEGRYHLYRDGSLKSEIFVIFVNLSRTFYFQKNISHKSVNKI